MILQVQGYFKDMKAQCNILNIGQPVLQVMTVLSSEISAKVIAMVVSSFVNFAVGSILILSSARSANTVITGSGQYVAYCTVYRNHSVILSVKVNSM